MTYVPFPPFPPRHYDTISVVAELIDTARLTLVDDFVTRGNTLLGAASRLSEAYPKGDVRAFALVRTKGRPPEVADVIEPCVGKIVRVGEDSADREP